MSVIEGGVLPYRPEAAERQRASFASRATADPLRQCFLPGIPRIMYTEFPFQIFRTDKLLTPGQPINNGCATALATA